MVLENGSKGEGFSMGTICKVREYLEDPSRPGPYYLVDKEGEEHFCAREIFSRVMGPLDEE